MLGMMLGSDIQVATFLMITVVKTAKLKHFSCKIPHAVANIKKYVVLLLLKMLVTLQLMLTNFEDFEYRSYICNCVFSFRCGIITCAVRLITA